MIFWCFDYASWLIGQDMEHMKQEHQQKVNASKQMHSLALKDTQHKAALAMKDNDIKVKLGKRNAQPRGGYKGSKQRP